MFLLELRGTEPTFNRHQWVITYLSPLLPWYGVLKIRPSNFRYVVGERRENLCNPQNSVGVLQTDVDFGGTIPLVYLCDISVSLFYTFLGVHKVRVDKLIRIVTWSVSLLLWTLLELETMVDKYCGTLCDSVSVGRSSRRVIKDLVSSLLYMIYWKTKIGYAKSY